MTVDVTSETTVDSRISGTHWPIVAYEGVTHPIHETVTTPDPLRRGSRRVPFVVKEQQTKDLVVFYF